MPAHVPMFQRCSGDTRRKKPAWSPLLSLTLASRLPSDWLGMFSVPSARSCKAWKSEEQINTCFLSSPPRSGTRGERCNGLRFLFLGEDGRPVLGSNPWAWQLALLEGPGSRLTCLSMNKGCQSQTLSFNSAAWQCPGLRTVLWHLPAKGSFYSLNVLASSPLMGLVKCKQSENARKEFLSLTHTPDADMGQGMV